MKILHVNGANYGGGLEQYLTLLFEELSKRGHENRFLYGQKVKDAGPLPDSHCYHIPDITNSNCLDITAKLNFVCQILGQEKPDIVYIHQVTNHSLIELMTKVKPSVRFAHGFKLICPDGKNALKTVNRVCPFPLSYFCELRAYHYRCMPRNIAIGLPLIMKAKAIIKLHQKHSYLVVASNFMKNQLVVNGFDAKKVEIIPYFTRLPEPKKAKNIAEPIILCLGRVVHEKGMQYLLKAFSELKRKSHLVIIGDGPMLDEIRRLAQSLDISQKVTFTGWLRHHDLDDFYRKASVVVVPSVWSEPFGIVGIEAMAYRKPVVAFDEGGISDWLVDGRTGFLTAPRDWRKMADNIRFLIDDPALAENFGAAGRKIVERKFLADSHIDNLTHLFKKTIRKFSCHFI